MRESYAWSRAKHPNVQQLIGIIMLDERLGMASLWMENGNLQHYIQKNPGADRYKLVGSSFLEFILAHILTFD